MSDNDYVQLLKEVKAQQANNTVNALIQQRDFMASTLKTFEDVEFTNDLTDEGIAFEKYLKDELFKYRGLIKYANDDLVSLVMKAHPDYEF